MIRGARSLDTLRGQLNAFAPKRSKLSDGGRASTAHTAQNPTSDHEPRLWAGGDQVWTAFDFTHDPTGGLDCQRLVDALVASRDPRVKYLIWRRRIWTPAKGWQPYAGPNPHDKHAHLSVAASPALFDDTSPWTLPGLLTPHQEELDMDEKTFKRLVFEVITQDDVLGKIADAVQTRDMPSKNDPRGTFPLRDRLPAMDVALQKIVRKLGA